MLNLFKVNINNQSDSVVSKEEKLSILYHNIFDFPLNVADLVKWKTGKKVEISDSGVSIKSQNGYYFLEGREGLIYKRSLRKRISYKKITIAKDASKILSLLPTVKFVGITGSLAMENSNDESDIDLLLVTSGGMLWTTRLITLILFSLLRIPVRRSTTKDERNKLCLNIWLDSDELVWKTKDRNLYTAHEIAQIVPLVNKEKTYEKFVSSNKWIYDYWPNALKVNSMQQVVSSIQRKSILYSAFYFLQLVLEKLAFKLQYKYMKSKITRETITPTRALFHPQDWGNLILGRLSSF